MLSASAVLSMRGIAESDEDQRTAQVNRMAAAIVRITREQGGCLPQDLLALGFSKDETIENWHVASATANMELKLTHRTEKKYA